VHVDLRSYSAVVPVGGTGPPSGHVTMGLPVYVWQHGLQLADCLLDGLLHNMSVYLCCKWDRVQLVGHGLQLQVCCAGRPDCNACCHTSASLEGLYSH
jgi:hypothetical protein